MIEFNENFVPVLSDKIEIKDFAEGRFILCLDNASRSKFIISQEMRSLIELVGHSRTIGDICSLYNQAHGAKLSQATVLEIFKRNISGLGIIMGDSENRLKTKNNYLKLKFTFLNEKLVRKFSKPFLPLFSKKVFLWTLILSILFISFFYVKEIHFNELYFGFNSVFGLWFIGIYIISHVFHELGHSAACIRFKANPGKIGIGFYFLRPVFFADVSDVWRLKKYQRLIVDMAGIYMQIIFCAVFVVAYIISMNRFFINMSFLVSTTLIFHLNPFFRYDGYWVLSDLIEIPNLRERSIESAKKFIHTKSTGSKEWRKSKLQMFLTLYAFSSLFFLVYFFLFVLIYERDAVLFFPIDLYSFFKELFVKFDKIDLTWLKWQLLSFIIPTTFYLLIIRILIHQCKKYLNFKTIKLKI